MENEVELRFGYKRPSREQIDVIVAVGEHIHHLAEDVDRMVPDSREKSLALTHLEEVRHWCNQAIATRWER